MFLAAKSVAMCFEIQPAYYLRWEAGFGMNLMLD